MHSIAEIVESMTFKQENRMNKAELKLAGRLLGMASETYSNHGCNDLEPKLFEGIDVVSRRNLEEAWNAWNCPSGESDQYVLLAHVGDDGLMAFLAHQLSVMAEVKKES